VRPIPKRPHYTITASLLGGRNYTRYEVAAVLQEAWSRYGWHYVENAPNHAPVDLDIRVLIEQDWLLVGIRLGEIPLHRRPYKLHSLPGSLKPPVAYCLCLLADIQTGQTVLDPMCGAGTIAIEAAALGASHILAADLNPEAVLSARNNIANAGVHANVLLSDARKLPFADSSIDHIVSNLPWGKQVSTTSDLDETYAALVLEFARVLPIGGRCVLLTDRGDLLLPPVESSRCFHVRETNQISLYGSHPRVYIIDRS
jgi:23S rRNA G2445 N2-methylase RlmL